MNKSALELIGVSKLFQKDGESVLAVDAVGLTVKEGELVTFLGPSGCGKTTTLRMVAGFELPTSGRITIKGKDMTNVPVNKRGIGFMFQTYALFPHMSVYNNVAYGLKARGEKDREIKSKVREALRLVGLEKTEHRFPNQLSGGEQQRVALARVIVMEPSLLLMDEPLSNLDAKLRIHMRTEIRKIQQDLGITCLYVTHDQSEALTMADRIVIMNKGRIEQIGTPFEIYSNPQSVFVADFIGQANIIRLKITAVGSDTNSVQIPRGGVFTARALRPERLKKQEAIYKVGAEASLIIRPEQIQLGPAPAKEDQFPAIVESAMFVGSHIEYFVKLPNDSVIKALVPYQTGMHIFSAGDDVELSFDVASAVFLPN